MFCVHCHTAQPALHSARIGAAVCSAACRDAAAPAYVLLSTASPAYALLARAPDLVAASTGGAHRAAADLPRVGGRVPVRGGVARALQRIGPNFPPGWVVSSSSGPARDAARAAAAATSAASSSSSATSASAASPAPGAATPLASAPAAEQRGTKREAEQASGEEPAAKAQDTRSELERLPPETLVAIMRELDFGSLVMLLRTSRTMRVRAQEVLHEVVVARFTALVELYDVTDTTGRLMRTAGTELLRELCGLTTGWIELLMRIAMPVMLGVAEPDVADEPKGITRRGVAALGALVMGWISVGVLGLAQCRTNPLVAAAVVYREAILHNERIVTYAIDTDLGYVAIPTPGAMRAAGYHYTPARIFRDVAWALPMAYATYGPVVTPFPAYVRHRSFETDELSDIRIALACILLVDEAAMTRIAHGDPTSPVHWLGGARDVLIAGDPARLVRVMRSVAGRFHGVARVLDRYMFNYNTRIRIVQVLKNLGVMPQDAAEALVTRARTYFANNVFDFVQPALLPFFHDMETARELPEDYEPANPDEQESDDESSEQLLDLYEVHTERALAALDAARAADAAHRRVRGTAAATWSDPRARQYTPPPERDFELPMAPAPPRRSAEPRFVQVTFSDESDVSDTSETTTQSSYVDDSDETQQYSDDD